MAVHRSALGVASLAAVTALALSACSSNVTDIGASTSTTPSTVAAAPVTPTTTERPTPTSTTVEVPAGLVGDGCADYIQRVPSGPGSLRGMAPDPVVVAISNSMELTTLAGALTGTLNSEVDLTDTLAKGQYTVFAPTDAAFGKLAPEVLEKFKTDPAALTAVLKYHIIGSELDTSAVVGEQKTLQGQSLTVTSAGAGLRVNDAAVGCGGITTANATVYLIDTVLMPPPPAPPAPTTSSTDSAGTTTATPTP